MVGRLVRFLSTFVLLSTVFLTSANLAEVDAATKCNLDPTSINQSIGGGLSSAVNVTITTDNAVKKIWAISLKDGSNQLVPENLRASAFKDESSTTSRTFLVPINITQPGNYTLHVTAAGGFECKIDDAFLVCLPDKPCTSNTPAPGKNPCEDTECPTAFGNIPTNPTGFTSKVLTIAIGLAGGIALIFMVYGSIKILTSSGDPKKVADGREIIVAAIAGTLFLILSVLILRFIGGTFLPTNPFG